MARKKLYSFTYSSFPNASLAAVAQERRAIVYYDAQWQDNIVEYYKNGEKCKDASSHHYDDREDAITTAQHYAQGK